MTASAGICPICDASYKFDVMGSAHPLEAVAPQQELPPDFTRRAASPYFCLTTSLISAASVVLMMALLLADFYDGLWFHRGAAGAAFGIEELQELQLLQFLYAECCT